MNRITRFGAVAGLVVTLVALGVPPVANAQPNRQNQQQELVEIPGGGTDLFRALLHREGIRPLTTNELRNMWGVSDDIIVIVVGGVRAWEWGVDPQEWLRKAVRAHGGALIASDSPVQLRESSWNNPVGGLSGNTVQANRQDCHMQFDDCPYVVPVSPKEQLKGNDEPGRVWTVFRGLNKLATNQPTYIQMNANGFQNEYQYPLARLPKSSTVGWQRFDSPPLFAVGGDGPSQWNGKSGYSFLAVADSSVYINQMIMEPGTDNLEFTLRTIEYLQGPDKRRKRCAFFENGKLIDKFDGLQQAMDKQKAKIPPDKVPNMGPLIDKNQDKLVDLGNRMADQIQNKDGVHNTILGREGTEQERRRFAELIEGLAVVFAIAISFYLLRRTFWARQPMDVPPPPATGAGTAPTGPPGVFERRQKELVRRNNLYEPVRNLMREFFDSVGAPPNPGPRMPRLVIDHRAVRKPESLRQAVRDMWRIAYGPPMYLSAQRWFELEPYFERLVRAHEDGKWRFETNEEEG